MENRTSDLKTPPSVARIPLWISIVTIIGILLIITGAVISDDLARGAFLLIPGLLVFAIVFLPGAWQLFGQAVWHIGVWHDLDTHKPSL